MNRTLTLLPPLLKDPPSISLKSPSSATTITVGSSIRLHADANDSNGDLYGIQFYSNQELLEAWSGSFDFNNSLPQDGETITLYDGTTNSALTFEFDDNQSVFGGGVPSAYASQANVPDDLTIEGNFTYFSAVQFIVEIDRLGDTDAGTADTFRWSVGRRAFFCAGICAYHRWYGPVLNVWAGCQLYQCQWAWPWRPAGLLPAVHSIRL